MFGNNECSLHLATAITKQTFLTFPGYPKIPKETYLAKGNDNYKAKEA